MLTEHFIASVGIPTRPTGTNVAKDTSIFIQEYQPLNAQRAAYKKSATLSNCLAVSATHIFAAQADKALVNVYNQEKKTQESAVPFTERITCLTLACNDTILCLGTAEGRIFLWETASGRQLTTAQSHLQSVTALVVDSKSNFLLSASADSTVHIWSVSSLLSFSGGVGEFPLPLRSFTSHKAKINALVLGHSSSFSNFAVSSSADKTCCVWDYFTGTLLRTYLLPSEPTCLTLDVADRAIYVGYDDGCIQQLDFFSHAHNNGINSKLFSRFDNGLTPVQPSQTSKWSPSDASIGAALCITISFDSSAVLSGHESGVILQWDIGRNGLPTKLLQTALPGPITNLSFLPVTGFVTERNQKLRIPQILKPKFGAFDSSSDIVPGNYALNLEIVSNGVENSRTAFEQALCAPSFPSSMIDEGINELLARSKTTDVVDDDAERGEDFMAFDEVTKIPRQLTLEQQNASLKSELDSLRRLQMASFEKIERINAEKKALEKMSSKKRSTKALAQANGDDGMEIDANESSSSFEEG